MPIWRDTDGNALAVRQTLGQGRVGAVWLSDSHALTTRGERQRHASLWAQLFAELARARAEPPARMPVLSIVGRRATLCAGSASLRVQTPDAQTIALPTVPGESSEEHCAGFWPRQSGWHRLQSTNAETPSATAVDAPFYVYSADTLDSLIAEADRQATRLLVNRTEPPSARSTDREHWRRLAVLAWLALIVVGWWIERRSQRTASTKAHQT